MILLPNQLFFAEVVDQPGVFLFGEPHPSMRAVLMAGDLGVAIFCSVILRRYGSCLLYTSPSPRD